MTQLELAKKGRTSELMKRVARREQVPAEMLRRGLANGRIVIPHNRLRKISLPCAIGAGLRTKINANIGTSRDSSDIRHELEKMDLAVRLGSDAVMDLSTGARLVETRHAIIRKARVPIGTVPIYEMVVDVLKKKLRISDISTEDIFSVLERQAKDGVDFFTIHAGVTSAVIALLKRNGRILDIVSRGGAFLADWILTNKKENPFYEHYDRVLDIARRYDVTLSLGDGLRPGAVADATDGAQIMELITLGELQKRAMARGVQAMIEGPGHVPLNQVEANVMLEKTICNGAPFYVLGPLVTDIAPGYDHITGAIGGALAAAKGADFLCYVTPAEHLRLPTLEDVRDGVIASKIAAHAADIAKGIPGAMDRDVALSKARKARDWKRQFAFALDPEKPRRYRETSRPGSEDVCTMCSEYCSIKIADACLKRGS